MIDENITDLLKKPIVPKELSEKLHLNWERKLEKEAQRKIQHLWKISYSLAACLFVTILSFSYWYSIPPDLIKQAYSDINKDRYLGNGVSTEVTNWFKINKLSLPSRTMKVSMSKFCKLDKHKTTHIRVLGEYKGKVDVFLSHTNFSTFLKKTSGKFNNKNWRIVVKKGKADIILVYSNDMKEESVEKLIRKILNV